MANNKVDNTSLKGPFYGVTAQTWGTHGRSGNGLVKQVDQLLFGGSMGHASLSMRLPNNEQTRKLIEQYCFKYTFEQFQNTFGQDKTFKEYLDYDNTLDITDPRAIRIRKIPVTLNKQSTREAKYDAKGQIVPTANVIYEQEYLQIDWSWWGSGPQSLEIDMENGREGYHFEYADKWKDYLNPEKRRHKGQFGFRDMDYAPQIILHQRDIPETELKRISRPEQILLLKANLNLINNLEEKIDAELDDDALTITMTNMLKNLGFNSKNLIDEANTYAKNMAGSHAETNHFKAYILQKLSERADQFQEEKVRLENSDEFFAQTKEQLTEIVTTLTETLKEIRAKNIGNKVSEEELELVQDIEHISSELSKIESFSKFYTENQGSYMVIGQPSNHHINLPFGSNGEAGLDPEAMLKAMSQIVDADESLFDIKKNNCSQTCIKILEEGAKHNETLHSILGKRVFGHYGTPQQMLDNAKLAQLAIEGAYTENPITSFINNSIFDKAIGDGSLLIFERNASFSKKALGYTIMFLAGIAKIPGIILEALLSPKSTFIDIIENLKLVYSREAMEKWQGDLLKIGITVLAFLPLVLITPFAFIQEVFETLFSKITVNRSDVNESLSDEPADEDKNNESVGGNKALVVLLNNKIKEKVDANTILVTEKNSPKETIIAFEDALRANPQKIVCLSTVAHDLVLDFIFNSHDEIAKQTFYKCCELSLARVKNHTPKNKEERDDLIKEVNPAMEDVKDISSIDSSPVVMDEVSSSPSSMCS